jgi:phage terminase small subunit
VEAGYADDRGNASALRQNTAIGQRIKELQVQAAERVGVSIERVLNELAKIGFANIADYMDIEDGKPVLSLARNSRDQLAAIAEVTSDQGRVKIKLLDKKGALVDLGRHLGMFVDKLKVEAGDIACALLTDNEYRG